ncbi:MAG: sigma-70 family RNA polymerase sigma factor [Ardenticatenaceae bacterium]|nr:sigma-70 family RNA polymerase sigma factor [Anaerolineales bacterium]MCB8923635.1 sigma-70 family RNA polymerase sigma factor [Ardenticatenaceae bacterium]MCB8991854.1 sigma-70 family RNA polymerase sigma factor [Ardenticatenaceae bacterium]MCB9005141.1 sigma-70 family RNA polymerase sigma factor [Ardenticatenaceae bacterium]
MLDDTVLIQQACDTPQAFGALYDKYVDRIFGYAYRLVQDEVLAEEVTAVTFEKALQNLPRYRPETPLLAWLYRIAHNEAMNQHRRRKWLVPWQEWRGKTGQRVTETAVLAHEHRQQLHHALGQLSIKDRSIITLRFFEGLSSAETAVILNCPVNTVYQRLHRALQRLEKQLVENGYL